MELRVTHVLRFDAGLYAGGGEVQALRTGQALRELGVDVRHFEPSMTELGDVVHFFGNFDYFDEIAGHLRRQGVPYVVSPIFVSPRTRPRLRWRSLRQRALGAFPRGSHRLLEGAKCLFTLTAHEEASIEAYFGTGLPPFVRVPNGVEPRFGEGDPDRFRARFRIPGPFVIHVGTIDRSKNQLGSIRACAPDVPLAILGRESDPRYAKKCRHDAGDNVFFLGKCAHDDPLLIDALAAAHVFVLPSYRELFPLSALEATAAGCNLALSNRWGGEEIWGGDAVFFDPDSTDDTRAAIRHALSLPKPNPERSAAYLKRFSWEAAAKQIVDVYRSVRQT